jgi:pimeloyl-ACP methyl ester carboxylesterase
LIWIIVVVVAILLTVLPLLIPKTDTRNLPFPESLADEDSQFLEINGISIHYKDFPADETGQNSPGKSFLLLHGFGSSMFSFREIIPALRQFGRVILFDRPGAGLSGRPVGHELAAYNPYSPAAQQELTTQIMDALGIERTTLVAHSAGGPLAVEAAYNHPYRVDALVLLSPSLYTSMALPSVLRFLLRSPQMAHLGPALIRATLSAAEDAPGRIMKMAWHDSSKIPIEAIREASRNTRVRNWDRSLWEFTLVSAPTRAAQHITQLRLPVVVVAGDNDRVVPLESHERLVEELPGARLVVVAHSGHNPQEEQSRETAGALIEFLKEHLVEAPQI